MSVKLEPPSQLSFHRPFTQLVKEILVVRNPNPEPVAFKVKTTAPKQYCVRPNSGRIEANQSVDVQVILQPMKEDPAPDFKCKDKFLVQSVAITAERETLTLTDLWSTTEKQAKDSIKETKIRCVYLPPVESNAPPTSPPPNSPPPKQSSSASSPTSPTSKKDFSNGTTSEAVKDERRSQSPPPSYKAHEERSSEKANGTTDRSVPPAATTNGHTSSRSSNMIGSFPKGDYSFPKNVNEENDPAKLRRQLLEAQEEIRRLNHTIDNYKQELNAAQMRQRKNEEATSTNRNSTIGGFSVKTQEKIPEGYYPFEVVVAAAVGAFLFGVMFF
uniref:Vesicle-associated membrane protein-associated protein C16G5.05c n=1 Tax=Anthurium amnicola TaxID=1678845 RepID=A0A1D1Z3G6_9ARAE